MPIFTFPWTMNLLYFSCKKFLFKSYFTDGEYPDVERVTSLAEGVGLNRDGVKAYISDATHQNQILTKARQWSGEGCFRSVITVKKSRNAQQIPSANQI